MSSDFEIGAELIITSASLNANLDTDWIVTSDPTTESD